MFTANVGLFVKRWHRDIAHGLDGGIETSNTLTMTPLNTTL